MGEPALECGLGDEPERRLVVQHAPADAPDGRLEPGLRVIGYPLMGASPSSSSGPNLAAAIEASATARRRRRGDGTPSRSRRALVRRPPTPKVPGPGRGQTVTRPMRKPSPGSGSWPTTRRSGSRAGGRALAGAAPRPVERDPPRSRRGKTTTRGPRLPSRARRETTMAVGATPWVTQDAHNLRPLSVGSGRARCHRGAVRAQAVRADPPHRLRRTPEPVRIEVPSVGPARTTLPSPLKSPDCDAWCGV